jgi:steroid delta-isomerase-like uncharacterized protein
MVVPGYTQSIMSNPVETYLDIWHRIVMEGKLELFDECFTADYTYGTPSMTLNGPAETKAYFGALLAAFSDVEFTVEDSFGAGDRVAKRWVFRGTHTGELSGIPATGKRVSLAGISLARMAGDKIAEERDVADDLGFLQQLGVIPALG